VILFVLGVDGSISIGVGFIGIGQYSKRINSCICFDVSIGDSDCELLVLKNKMIK
jgi:hypothetical protein